MQTDAISTTGTRVSTLAYGELTETWIVELVRPLVGFDASRQFVVRSLGSDYEPYRVLASLDEPGLEFIVVHPGALFSDYVFELPESETMMLELDDPTHVEVLVLVTGRSVATPTVNLIGPVVINTKTSRGAQIVLQDERYSVATPVNVTSARRANATIMVD